MLDLVTWERNIIRDSHFGWQLWEENLRHTLLLLTNSAIHHAGPLPSFSSSFNSLFYLLASLTSVYYYYFCWALFIARHENWSSLSVSPGLSLYCETFLSLSSHCTTIHVASDSWFVVSKPKLDGKRRCSQQGSKPTTRSLTTGHF